MQRLWPAKQHAGSCNFYKKMLSCLKDMDRQNITPTAVRKFYKSQNDYKNRSNVMHAMSNYGFTPFVNADPDAFLPIMDELETAH